MGSREGGPGAGALPGAPSGPGGRPWCWAGATSRGACGAGGWGPGRPGREPLSLFCAVSPGPPAALREVCGAAYTPARALPWAGGRGGSECGHWKGGPWCPSAEKHVAAELGRPCASESGVGGPARCVRSPEASQAVSLREHEWACRQACGGGSLCACLWTEHVGQRPPQIGEDVQRKGPALPAGMSSLAASVLEA